MSPTVDNKNLLSVLPMSFRSHIGHSRLCLVVHNFLTFSYRDNTGTRVSYIITWCKVKVVIYIFKPSVPRSLYVCNFERNEGVPWLFDTNRASFLFLKSKLKILCTLCLFALVFARTYFALIFKLKS